jgi:hypothetical protein
MPAYNTQLHEKVLIPADESLKDKRRTPIKIDPLLRKGVFHFSSSFKKT